MPPLVNPPDAGNVLEFTAFALVAVAALPPTEQDVHVPVRLVITPEVGVPSAATEIAPLELAIVVPSGMTPPRVELVAAGREYPPDELIV